MPNGEGKQAKQRVEILGGGAAGLAAAWELTATDELREKLQVTVHQVGWRLGGKGASGRLMDGGSSRIHEHGLHIWFGWYQQAFDLMKHCYEALPPAAKDPFATWRQAFEPFDSFVLMEQWRGKWYPRSYRMLSVKGQPWEPRPPIQDSPDPFLEALRQALEAVIRWIAPWGRELEAPIAQTLGVDPLEEGPGPQFGYLGIEERPNESWRAQVIGRLDEVLEPPPGEEGLETVKDIAERFVAAADEILPRLIPKVDDMEASRVWHRLVPRARDVAWIARTTDFARTVVSGMLNAGYFDGEGAIDFCALDTKDFSEWLGAEGMLTRWDRVPFVRGGYDLTFGYPKGDRDKPDMAAGVTLRSLLPILVGHRGGFMWKMQTGMGDAVFAPLYAALRERGVRFRFFEWVEKLELDDAKRHVQRIHINEQVELVDDDQNPKPGHERWYSPLTKVGTACCWPDTPLWEQIKDGKELKDAATNLEHDVGHSAGKHVLERGGKPDDPFAFDHVVLALPAGVHADVCTALRVDRDFARMVDTSETVGTRAMQLWLTRSGDDLRAPERASVAGAFNAAFDTVADMSQVIRREGWPDDATPAYLAYFCSVIPAQGGHVARDPVQGPARDFVEDVLKILWPGFDKQALPDPPRTDPSLLDLQYLRANSRPHEGYVLSRKGTICARLDQSYARFPNLVLAGDWTKTGIDAGCVEAAVISGRRAGRELASRIGCAPAPSPFPTPDPHARVCKRPKPATGDDAAGA
jgi:uncharacterized protein with NAD-binding domain and iron-sulfur cluster